MVSELTPAQVLQAAREIQNLEDARVKDSLPFFEPFAKQEKALMLLKGLNEVLFYGPNSCGKSYLGAKETACQLRGEDPSGTTPGREYPKPRRRIGGVTVSTDVWMGCNRRDKGITIVRNHVIPFLPQGYVLSFNETRGLLKCAEGQTLHVMSYEDDVRMWESDSIDFVWCDEPPPKPHLNAARSRTARRSGKILITMSPERIVAPYLYWEFIKNLYGRKDIGYVAVGVDDNIYLTEEPRQQLITSFAGTDDECWRVFGEWPLSGGIIHQEFEPHKHIIEPFEITEDLQAEHEFFRVSDIHTRANDVCLFIMAKRYPHPEFTCFHEITMPEGEHIVDFKRRVHEETKALGFTSKLDIIDVSDDCGQRVRAELARRPYSISGIRANRSLHMGVSRFNEFLREGAFKITSDCRKTIHSIQSLCWADYHGMIAEEKNVKEKHVAKDDHWVRNIHYATLHLPSRSDKIASLDKAREMRYSGTKYIRNYVRKQG